MKQTFIIAVSGLLLMSSCGTYTGQGAYAGASLGSILGSAIGGISGGWRGSDIGSIVGMAGGAAVGAAIGSAADQKQQEKIEQYQKARQQRAARMQQQEDVYYDTNSRGNYQGADDSGFDATGSGDDRIVFDGAGPRSEVSHLNSSDTDFIEIRHARIVDSDRDGIIRAGEECRVTFEVMNRSQRVLYDVQPTVIDVTGNKHIHISPNLHVESIAPNSGVRYTATILADKKLKDGTAVIRVGVALGNREVSSQYQEFSVKTRRR